MLITNNIQNTNKIKIYFICIFIFLIKPISAQQINISELTELNQQIEETSGLIYYNGKLITHNDSGNLPYLYEIDTTNGGISRTVIIKNASNIDWEDITQDSLHIYVADIGNNSGDRTNLRIYIILKSDYLTNDSVYADTINFTYNNQTNFTSNPQNTEFDAEAISIYNDSIIIFTKDWVNNTTKTYILPKTPGNYIAYQRNYFNCNGLITGSCYNNYDTSFVLCGYTQGLAPFIIQLKQFSDTNIFDGLIYRFNLTDSIGGSQIEGVCPKIHNKYFLSREHFSYQTVDIKPALFSFNFTGNNTKISNYYCNNLSIYPNPATNLLTIKNNINIDNLKIYNISGNIIKKINVNNSKCNININDLSKGIYILKISGYNYIKYYKFIKQ